MSEFDGPIMAQSVANNDALRAALGEVMEWIGDWDPNFIHDDEWPPVAARVPRPPEVT